MTFILRKTWIFGGLLSTATLLQGCMPGGATSSAGPASSSATNSALKLNTPPSGSTSTAILTVNIPDPIFPVIPAASFDNARYATNSSSGITVGTTVGLPGILAGQATPANLMPQDIYGSAIYSLTTSDGFQYVANVNQAFPQYQRGSSLQASFFFDTPISTFTDTATNTTFQAPSYYNDCDNPLESGSVADFSSPYFGITSPTAMYSPSSNVLQSRSQLALYIARSIPAANWTCAVGAVNVPPAGFNNAQLSNDFLGKTVTVGNIGTNTNPINISNVIAVDYVLQTGEANGYNFLDIAFAGLNFSSLKQMYTVDPRSGAYYWAPPMPRDNTPPAVEIPNCLSYENLPVIVASSDLTHAFATYTPQIPLTGEGSNKTSPGSLAYMRDIFNNAGTIDTHAYIRTEYMPAGVYKYKVYYIVGTFDEVKNSLIQLYSYFKILDPAVFDWAFYVAGNNLGSMTEDQARLHWVTTGASQGLASSSGFSVKTYLASNPTAAAKFGSNYYAAILDYVSKNTSYPITPKPPGACY